MTTFRPLLLLPLVTSACDGGGKTEDLCEVTVSGTLPAAGDAAGYRDPFGFLLSAPDPAAVITTDVPGQQATSDDGLTVTWVPDSPLAPETAYHASLTFCGGTQDLDFTTSDLGKPLIDPQALVGRVYAVNLPEANIVSPAGLGGFLGPMLAVVLAEVVAVSDTDLDVLGAVAVTGSAPPVEDYCTPTIDFPPGAFAEQPYFHLGPADVDLVVSGSIVTVGDLELTGTFSADGSYFGGGVFTGLVDTRPLSLAQNPDGDGSDVCVLVSGLGVECANCPTDGQPFCLSLIADNITAQATAGGDVVEVLGYNCEGCADGPPAVDATCED